MARQLHLDQREYIEIVNSRGEVTGGFYWNPSDFGIVKRCEKVMDFFNHMEVPEGLSDNERNEFLSNKIRSQFDFLLSPGAAEEVFKWIEPLSVRPDGAIYAEYALHCVTEFVKSEMNVRIGKTTAKIEEYTAKYQDKK